MQNEIHETKKIQKIVQLLDRQDSDWRQHVKTSNESSIENVAQFREYVTDLLFEIREYIKYEDSLKVNEIYDRIGDDDLSDSLVGQAETLLIHYKAMAPLRILEKEDFQLCNDFLKYAMENYVCRLDINCLNSFSQYKFANCKEMQKTLESIDMLSDYYVKSSFSAQTIRQDFYDETGLSQLICDYYAKLIDLNYQNIKLNIILEKMEALEGRMKDLFH